MLYPRKQFGQHWLRSEQVLDSILNAAQLKPDDCVLEIGPGTGNLTTRLLPMVRSLVAVEVDRDLCVKLRRKFTQDNFQLIEADILKVPLPIAPNKVVANIPYNITGPILEKLLGNVVEPVNQFERIVLLVQKEIAERLTARAGHKAYGAMSVRVQYLAACQFVCDVPAQAFYPPPKVDSAVVCIQPGQPVAVASNPQFLNEIVRLGFATRRKMLRNNLSCLVDRDRLTILLEQLQVDPQARAEDLSVTQWVALSERLPSIALNAQA